MSAPILSSASVRPTSTVPSTVMVSPLWGLAITTEAVSETSLAVAVTVTVPTFFIESTPSLSMVAIDVLSTAQVTVSVASALRVT